MATQDHDSDRQASAATPAAPGLFDELRRRNVIRMAGLYLVGAWLLVQVASTLFPAFGVPGWAVRALVIVIALGFVSASIFARVFELTPDGIKRDAAVPRGQSIAPQTAQCSQDKDTHNSVT